MKNILLYTLGIMLLGMTGFNGNLAEAAGPTGWNQTLKCDTSCPRFTILKNWDYMAVLDKETGLVWEQSPDSTTRTWSNAHTYCNDLAVSNRKGWRLPTFQELSSLVDTSQTNPSIPIANPFGIVENNYYWSATGSTDAGNEAWALNFSDSTSAEDTKSTSYYVWCVRGGSGVDLQ